MPKALIAPMTLATLGGPFQDLLRSAGFELVFPSRPAQMTENELLAELKDIQAVLAGSEPYTQRVLAANPSLRVIARAGVGYDAVDLDAATKLGVAVTIAPGTNQESVAEHAFALILGLAKNLVPQHLAVKAGQWPRGANVPLRGRVLGLAGLGRIGKAMAVRGAAFGMRLQAHEPIPDAAFVAQYRIMLVSLDQLLEEADYLSLHLPMTPQSRHLINRQTLARMKPTAFLINTARGGLVHEPDLVEALRSKQLAGAGLDVFDQEPPATNHPLLELENVLFTSHMAGTDSLSRDEMALSAARAIVALSRGEWPAEQIVNQELRGKFRW